MKPELEIQRAHDILVAVLLAEVDLGEVSAEDMTAIHNTASVLCWVLDHDHNPKFTDILTTIETALEKMGWVLRGPDEGGPDASIY